MQTRRQFLGTTVLGGGLALAAGHAQATQRGGGGGPSDTTVPNVVSEIQAPRFELPLRMLPVAEPVRSDDAGDIYEITMREGEA